MLMRLHLLESVHVDFVIEVTCFQRWRCSSSSPWIQPEDSLVTSGGDEDIGNANKVPSRTENPSMHA
jgi:hypothetical protein